MEELGPLSEALAPASRRLARLPGCARVSDRRQLEQRLETLKQLRVDTERVVGLLAMVAPLLVSWHATNQKLADDRRILVRVRRRLQAARNRLNPLRPFSGNALESLDQSIRMLKLCEARLRVFESLGRIVRPAHKAPIWTSLIVALRDLIGESLATAPRDRGGFRWRSLREYRPGAIPDTTYTHIAWLLHLAYPAVWPKPTAKSPAALKARASKQ